MIELVIPYRNRSIGSMSVRRVLPFPKRRAVGPFVFVDDFGPVEIVGGGKSLDVLPHPHIGLATVTFLFGGKMTHRDSIGSVQVIEPGEVNWMSAGRGVVHSERVSDLPELAGENLLGVQTWVALPEKYEETAPSFAHHTAEELPVVEAGGARAKIILGEIFGVKSPVETLSDPVYADCFLQNKASLSVPAEIEDRSVYILSGALLINGQKFETGTMVVFEAGKEAIIEAAAEAGARFMIIGGARLEKPRYMWWNFVSSSPDRIEAAKEDWREGRFAMIPGETEFIPLPENNYPKPIPQPL
ncbi:MAG: pirin family protein [Acidobacteriota bacterium]|nr:pirin family protein [Acidobacteriota bacterium]